MKINIKHQTGKDGGNGSIAIKFYIKREKAHIPTHVELKTSRAIQFIWKKTN